MQREFTSDVFVFVLLKGAESQNTASLFAAGDVSSRNVPSGEERGETDVFAG